MKGLLSVLWVLLMIVMNKCASIEIDNFVDLSRTRRQAPDRSALPEGYHAFPEDKVAYKIYHDWETWDAARAQCKSDGGDLAIADTRDKVEHIQSVYTGFEDKFHVGIHKPTALQEWKTVSNDSVELSSSFIAGLRDSPDWLENDRVCAVLRLSVIGLEGDDCMLIKSFVCEIPIDTNPTGAKVDPSERTMQDPRSPALPEGYTIFPHHNVAYKIHKEALPWDAARGKCKTDGGDLAIADTLDKIQYIQNMDSSKIDWIFVGIYRPVGTVRWKTVEEGLFRASLPWASWMHALDSKNCAAIVLSEVGLGATWCTLTNHFVCEIPIHEYHEVAEVITTTTTTTSTTTPATTMLTPTLPPPPPPPPSLPLPTIARISRTSANSNYPDGYMEFSEFHTAYKICDEHLTHYEARRRCFSDGGRLAVVDSFEKINAVSPMLKTESVHVGFRIGSVHFEEWVVDSNGELTKDLPWTADNPHPTKCAALRKDGSGLEETLCSNQFPYLCEIRENSK